jgi:hypothetical protein
VIAVEDLAQRQAQAGEHLTPVADAVLGEHVGTRGALAEHARLAVPGIDDPDQARARVEEQPGRRADLADVVARREDLDRQVRGALERSGLGRVGGRALGDDERDVRARARLARLAAAEAERRPAQRRPRPRGPAERRRR